MIDESLSNIHISDTLLIIFINEYFIKNEVNF